MPTFFLGLGASAVVMCLTCLVACDFTQVAPKLEAAALMDKTIISSLDEFKHEQRLDTVQMERKLDVLVLQINQIYDTMMPRGPLFGQK